MTDDDGRHYNIVRFFKRRPGYHTLVAERVTLAEAQAHCKDPETSSSTCTGANARRRTRRSGDWFDGYEQR